MVTQRSRGTLMTPACPLFGSKAATSSVSASPAPRASGRLSSPTMRVFFQVRGAPTRGAVTEEAEEAGGREGFFGGALAETEAMGRGASFGGAIAAAATGISSSARPTGADSQRPAKHPRATKK